MLIARPPLQRRLLALAVIVFSSSLVGCRTGKTESAGEKISPEENTVVTVLLDFSASFAPFTANDARVLNAVKTVIGTKATHDWKGTTQVLVRKIGTSSILNAPVCEPLTYSPHLVGSGDDQDSFQMKLAKCLDSQAKANPQRKGEEFTDISGAIELASQATQSVTGRKVLLIVSDFVEEQAPSARATTLHLSGERVIMLHRPGTDDKTIPSHLSRIAHWRKTLIDAGASTVAAIPVAWATPSVLDQSLSGISKGTLGLVLLDGNSLSVLGGEEPKRQRLMELAVGLGQLAKDWPPPVTILWYALPSTPASISWMPSIEYEPRLIEQKGDVNSTDELVRELRETAIGALRLAKPAPASALVDALLLLHASDVIGTRQVNAFLVSDLAGTAQTIPPDFRFQKERVSIVYSPARSDAADPNLLFGRLTTWKALLTKIGASRVCALELSSLTSDTLGSCAGRGGA